MHIIADSKLETTKNCLLECCRLRFLNVFNYTNYVFKKDEYTRRRYVHIDVRDTILKNLTNNLFILINGDGNAQIWHYVLAYADKKELLSYQSKKDSIQNIEDYGTVLYSGWGQDPPESISNCVGIKYFFMESKNDNFDKNQRNQLHDAARSGDFVALRYLLTKGADVNSKDKNGWTPLHHAAFSGKLQIVKILVSKNSSVHAEDFTCGRKPIHIAAREGHVDVVKFFLKENLWTDIIENWMIPWIINFGDDNNWKLLHYAAWKGHVEMVEFLINSRALIDAKDVPFGKTPIHVAAAQGHTNIVELFLNRGMNIDVADYDGRTALCYSAQNGHFETTKFLINSGKKKTNDKITFSETCVDLNRDFETTNFLINSGKKKTNDKITFSVTSVDRFQNESRYPSQKSALHLATSNNHLNIIDLLLTSGININITDKDGRTPLHYAASRGLLEAATLLVERGANMYAETKDGLWPVQFAASKGHLIVTELFLSSGLDIHRTDKDGRSLLHYVTSIGQLETTKLLLDRGANMYAETKEGLLPVHIAASNGSLYIIELFLDNGMNIEAVDKDGRTALYYAAWKGHLEVLKFLIGRNANIHAENIRYVTPLSAATDLDVKIFLISNGAMLEVRDKDGLTPLFYSVIDNCLDGVKLLVNEGANIKARDNDGKTPLDIAREYMHTDIAKFLVSIYRKRCDYEEVFHIYHGELVTELFKLKGLDFFCHSEVNWKKARPGLYTAAFYSRGVNFKGICYGKTRCFSQALFLQSEELFLNNMQTSAEIYERLAQGRQVSAREEKEVFAFSKFLHRCQLLYHSDRKCKHFKHFHTLGDLSLDMLKRNGNLIIHLVLKLSNDISHAVAVYRTNNNFAYFDCNDMFIYGLAHIELLMQIVESRIFNLYGEVEIFAADFNVKKANYLLSSQERQFLVAEIKLERQLLTHQDKSLGLLNINGHKLSRVQLYDLGTKIHIERSVPMLINADHNLNNKNILDYIDTGEIFMTARDYLLKCSDLEVKKATKLIPFIGSNREIKDAKQLQCSVLFSSELSHMKPSLE